MNSSSKAKGNVDNGPVQQLVAMFSSLVAQGEQSAAMLEILISSISADLLAQVVMANMPNLPPVRPKQEGDQELLNTGSQDNNLSAYLTDILSRSTNSQLTHSVLDAHIDEVYTYYYEHILRGWCMLEFIDFQLGLQMS